MYMIYEITGMQIQIGQDNAFVTLENDNKDQEDWILHKYVQLLV